MKKTFFLFCGLFSLWAENSIAQDRLYPSMFSLSDVTLLDGPLKKAQDLNITTLLKYDVDRLLATYFSEAGLTPKGTNFSNWSGLDGHVGGHYLSALAMCYASTGNTQCQERMNYMVTELEKVQNAYATNADLKGYVGGVPNGKSLWFKIKSGNVGAVWDYWVPWYNVHKTFAGLRDAWVYGGNTTAKTMFLKFCDWAISLTGGLSDSQMEQMLGSEHGGMNEVLADAYAMTQNTKYLTAAKRFSHKWLLNAMAANTDNLDNKHANTQVPKAVGFERIAELTDDQTYDKAAKYFWKTVTEKRSIAIGANSREEFFPAASEYKEFVEVREGPETCNSYNMLKLTEGLFRMSPEAKYVDFYERSLYNHILSTQHPQHGGYVYFTPARPRHYRVYSQPNSAMWCCVGSGMENHVKYGRFIYTNRHDSLFVNLFVASTLNWKSQGVTITQKTTFPDEEKTQLTLGVTNSPSFTLMIRHPSWVPADGMKVIIGTDTVVSQSTPASFVPIHRSWNNGDVVTVLLPMHNTVEALPNLSSYVALLHGPIVLGAKTGTESLTGLIANDGRWSHIASGPLQALDQAPILVGNRNQFPAKLLPVTGKPLTFKAPEILRNNTQSELTLEPFFRIHDSRYMMYWMALSEEEYQTVLDSLSAEQKETLLLDARTIDRVAPGEQQPEADHQMQTENSTTGSHLSEFYRDAGSCSGGSGGSISYVLSTQKETDLSLMVRYWGNESCTRTFDILIDGKKLVTENIINKWNVDDFVNQEYKIPNSMVTDKSEITVKFQASSGMVGGIFYVRLLREYAPIGAGGEYIRNGTFVLNDKYWKLNVNNGKASGSALKGEYQINVDQKSTKANEIQLVQDELYLQKGKTYNVSFDAYASVNRNLDLNIGMKESPWTSYLKAPKTFKLETDKHSYSMQFTMEEPTDTNAQIEFHAGSSTGKIFIDNISLKADETTSTKPPQITPQKLIAQLHYHHPTLSIELQKPSKEALNIKLYDLKGKLVKTGMIPAGATMTVLQMNGLNGAFIIKISQGGSMVYGSLIYTKMAM